MLTWEIIVSGMPDIRIRARSFSEALEKARLRNPGYCCGYVVEDDE